MGPTAKVDFLLIVEKKGVLKTRRKTPNYEDL
jgi:hypothetical protein